MNPNDAIARRFLRLHERLQALQRKLLKQAERRVTDAVNEIRGKLLTGMYPGPFDNTSRLIAADVVTAILQTRDWYLEQLRDITVEMNRRIPQLFTGKRQESEGEFVHFESEDDEEDDLQDLIDTILAGLQFLSNQQLLIIFWEWTWRGFTYRQHWENLAARQYQIVFQAMMGAAAMAQSDPQTYTVSLSARQSMAAELWLRTVGGKSPQSTMGAVRAAMVTQAVDAANQLTQSNMRLNSQYLSGVRRYSSLESNTCRFCLGLHGKFYPLVDGVPDGLDLPSHAFCQCFSVPEIVRFPGGNLDRGNN